MEIRWPNWWFAISKQGLSCAYSAAPSGMAGAWRKRCGIFCATPPRKKQSPRVGWEPKSPPCFERSDWTRIFLNSAGMGSSLHPSIDDYPRHQRAFGADEPNTRPEGNRLAGQTAQGIRLDNFRDGPGGSVRIADNAGGKAPRGIAASL